MSRSVPRTLTSPLNPTNARLLNHSTNLSSFVNRAVKNWSCQMNGVCSKVHRPCYWWTAPILPASTLQGDFPFQDSAIHRAPSDPSTCGSLGSPCRGRDKASSSVHAGGGRQGRSSSASCIRRSGPEGMSLDREGSRRNQRRKEGDRTTL